MKKKEKAPKPKRVKPDYKELWKGMPEFVNDNLSAVCQIKVSFNNKEDMHKFSKLIGQPITAKTKSVWYPQVPTDPRYNKRYSDES